MQGSLVDRLRALRIDCLPDTAQRLASIEQAWPAHVDAIAAAVAAAVGDAPEPAAAVAALHLEDLALATVASRDDARAVRELDAVFTPVALRSVAAVRGAREIGDDVVQRVRIAVMVAAEGRPAAIAGFSGRSSLAVWLRVITTREAVRMVRRYEREAPVDDDRLVEILSPEHDPELAYMKSHYREQLTLAFREAVASLADDRRTLLHQSVVDRVGIDRLAQLHDVHRATIARRIESARRELVAAVHARLEQRLNIDAPGLASVLRLIESQLDITLGGLAPRRRKRAAR